MHSNVLVIKDEASERIDTRPVRMNGKEVQRIRKNELGWSQAQAAAKAGVDVRVWAKVERKNGPVQTKVAHAIANALSRALCDLLLEFEVESYKVALKVIPLVACSETTRAATVPDIKFGYGIPPLKSEPITTDNKAFLQKTVTFSNRVGACSAPFELSYRTRNRGLISIVNNHEVSNKDLNVFLDPGFDPHASRERARERSRYDDNGGDVMYLVRAQAGSTHTLDLEVYKGYDAGQRNLTCYLPGLTNYERPAELTFNLTEYQMRGYKLIEEPKVVFFPNENWDRHEHPENYVGEDPGIAPLEATPDWKWKWTIHVSGSQGGVLYLCWRFEGDPRRKPE